MNYLNLLIFFFMHIVCVAVVAFGVTRVFSRFLPSQSISSSSPSFVCMENRSDGCTSLMCLLARWPDGCWTLCFNFINTFLPTCSCSCSMFRGLKSLKRLTIVAIFFKLFWPRLFGVSKNNKAIKWILLFPNWCLNQIKRKIADCYFTLSIFNFINKQNGCEYL